MRILTLAMGLTAAFFSTDSYAQDGPEGDGWTPVYWKGSSISTQAVDKTKISRISLRPDGSEAPFSSEWPEISEDGRYVTMMSPRTNLLPGESGGSFGFYRIDTDRGFVVSVSPNLPQVSDRAPISRTGRYIAFGMVSSIWEAYWRDMVRRIEQRVDVNDLGEPSDDRSRIRDITPDGRYVLFASDASNLIPGDVPLTADLFRRDMTTGEIVLAGPGGRFGAISDDGRYVAHTSFRSDLVANDTNGESDIFHYDIQTGQSIRVSVSTAGVEANSFSVYPDISADGTKIVFESNASNLILNDGNSTNDIFHHDVTTGVTLRVSEAYTGGDATNWSEKPRISGDGRYVAYISRARQLVPNDTNFERDAFVTDITTGETARVNVANDGTEADERVESVVISANGKFLAFHTFAANLVPNDTNNTDDVFLTPNPLANQLPVPKWWYRCVDLTCDFFANQSFDSDGSIVSYFWKFETGVPGKFGRSVSHTFSGYGEFRPFLTVKDDDGEKAKKRRIITLTP